MRRSLLVAAAAGLIAPATVRAQIAPFDYLTIDVGRRVRVQVTDSVTRSPAVLPSREVVGTVRAIAPDTLYLGLDVPAPAGATAIPRARIQSLEMSLGPPSRLASARHLGTYGALLGAIVGQAPRLEPERRFGSTFAGVALGIGVGYAAGALFGVIRPYERWRFAFIPE